MLGPARPDQISGQRIRAGLLAEIKQGDMLMTEQASSAVQRAPVLNAVKVSEAQSLIERANRISEQIARRAYQLFEADGFPAGRDLEHWLRAESELLHPVPVSIRESESALTVQAEAPGFSAADLQIGVEPRRVTISGKRETKEESRKGKSIYQEQTASEIFRVIALPAEIDTAKAAATLNNGIIELTLPKASQTPPRAV